MVTANTCPTGKMEDCVDDDGRYTDFGHYCVCNQLRYRLNDTEGGLCEREPHVGQVGRTEGNLGELGRV